MTSGRLTCQIRQSDTNVTMLTFHALALALFITSFSSSSSFFSLSLFSLPDPQSFDRTDMKMGSADAVPQPPAATFPKLTAAAVAAASSEQAEAPLGGLNLRS